MLPPDGTVQVGLEQLERRTAGRASRRSCCRGCSGLAIARGIVERHGGTIRAGASEALGGARFDVELPRAQPLLGMGRADGTMSRDPDWRHARMRT